MKLHTNSIWKKSPFAIMKYVKFQDLIDYCNCYNRKFCMQKSDDIIEFFTFMVVCRRGKVILKLLISYPLFLYWPVFTCIYFK